MNKQHSDTEVEGGQPENDSFSYILASKRSR